MASSTKSHSKKQFEQVIDHLEGHYPNMPEFAQAVEEVGRDVFDFLKKKKDDSYWKAFRILTEPDRVIRFRVDWEDDDGVFQCNHGYRVQFNNALGPYKGGLRFSADTKIDTLMFLAFEQTFKNGLTGLPMGGAKGGADFDIKNRSESEIRRFCQAFMTQLSHHIGPDTDVPAGDIGVGTREIGYMFHQYKSINNKFRGVLTGKHPVFGGSCIREEATGYGAVYFTVHMLDEIDDSLKGKRCALTGAGNVALFTAKKLIEMDAKVISLSNSDGTCVFEEGITADELDSIIEAHENRIRMSELDNINCDFKKGEKPWGLKPDIAFACATQNELDIDDAKVLVEGECKVVIEAANMPCTKQAIEYFEDNEIVMGPSKAVNAGGVAVSGLEISQNRSRVSWESSEVDTKLKEIMKTIHDTCVDYGDGGKVIDYRRGANLAAFDKLSQALYFSGLI